MKKTLALLLLPLLAACTTPPENPQTTVRTQAFKALLRDFEPMGVMLRERDSFRKDSFATHAEALKQIADTPFQHFPAGSAGGRAKPEIRSQPQRFADERARFLQAVDQLASSAHGDDTAAIRRSYGAVAQSCKSCHDAFRGPER